MLNNITRPKAKEKAKNKHTLSGKTFKKVDPIAEFICSAVFLSAQMHIFHLNTKSYAEHMALGEFYEGFPLLVDRLAEVYLSDNPGLAMLSPVLYKDPMDLLCCLSKQVNELKCDCRSTNNVLDDIAECTRTIMYKLTLK